MEEKIRLKQYVSLRSKEGGKGAPLGNDYTKIYSTKFAFVALKADGSITAWGDSNRRAAKA
jgi:hypothetical protein